MITAALFTIAKTWKQRTCPLTDDWIKKTCCVYAHVRVYTYTMEYYSVLKKNEIMLFATP